VVACGCADSASQVESGERRSGSKIGPQRKTTQDVLDLREALQAGATPAAADTPSQGLDAMSAAAVASTATIGMLAVEQKMKFFEAEEGRKPATHAEFMQRIIEKGGPGAVFLPALPSGQAYAFDPQRKALVIVVLPQEQPVP